MRRGKRIVDIDIAERGELTGEFGIVRLLGGVKAQILEQGDIALSKTVDDALRGGTDAILGELGFGPDETRALHLQGAV